MRNALVTGVSREPGSAMRSRGDWWRAEPGGTDAVTRELGVPFVEADFADPHAPAQVVDAAQKVLGSLDASS